jgi:hypothetical protein
LRHRVQVGQTAHVFGLAQLGQGFENGDHVGRLGRVNHLDDLLEDDAVVVAIVFAASIGNAVERGIIAQQTADDGLFCFDGMRRDAERIDLRIGGGVHGANYTCLRAAKINEMSEKSHKKAGRTRLFIVRQRVRARPAVD